ncbi:MAG TPA: hypothetical protein VED17_01500 [Nitrososphaerales archaeon]|nr:hypothetical protein [Nitrososphaerales archaeon]
MGAASWAAAIIVIIVVFALFVPIFPMSSQSGNFFGATYQVDADVSLSFLVSHCGSYMNAHSSASLGSITITHQISKGYNFSCNFSTSKGSSSVVKMKLARISVALA